MMFKFSKPIALFVFVLTSTAPIFAQKLLGNADDINAIQKVTSQFSSYYVEGDIDKLVACYTKDGKIFPANQDIIENSDALAEYWKLPTGVSVLKHKVACLELEVVSNTAYDHGYYEGETLKADGTKVSWKGKYVIVWKKIGDDWKIYLDIWNKT